MFASLIYPDIFNTVFLLPEKDYSNLRLSLGGTAGNHLLSGGLIASYFIFSYIHKLFKQNLKGEITVFIIFTLLLLSSFDIGIFNILNPFFKIPFPFYNRFTWCLFFAFIVSIEIDRSLTSKNQPYFLRCFHLLCVLSVVCWAYLSGHFVIQTHFYLHFSLYIIFLLFINKKKYKYLIIFFLLFEAIYPAYQYFYHSGFLTIKNNQLDTKINGTLYKNINNNPLYQQKDSITGPFISDQSMINNFSWLNNQPSVLGFDAKPLSPLFYTTLKNFLRSFPWDSNFDYISLQFLKNIGTKNFYTLNKSFFVDDMYLFSNGEKSLLMNSQKIQTPAPFAFFPTQIKKSNQEKQLDHILWDDIMLKSHAHVNLVNSSQNQILSLERKNNSITIKVRQPRNSILILNQTFDSNWTSLDKETEIFPINYFQTGILIKGVGVKKVSLSYWPSEWNLAFLFILLSACLMIFIKAVNIYRIKSFVRHMSQHIIK
ncbi:MAG: hypothetical protein HON90_02050 [Halobacteriovoraceae bacterium]|nr:hypothetical protein [Halobacteriovoraceae bacterium]